MATIVTGGVQDRYVRVRLSGSDYLDIAEVQTKGARHSRRWHRRR
jgi:hypothetical protein